MSKKSLGRGLSAILGEVAEAYEKEVPQNQIIEIDIDSIRTNPYQPRKHFEKESLQELADSIKSHGLLQPIIVVEDIDGFMLIAGERRLRASKIAGLSKIRAIVAKIDKKKFREFALIENIQREDLSPLDLANSYKELIEDYGITHEELAEVVKKSRVHITNTLRLLTLGKRAKEALAEGKISPGHAKVMVGLDEAEQEKILNSILGQKLSVRQTEKLVQQSKKSESFKIDLTPLRKKLDEIGIEYKIERQKLILEFKEQKDIEKFLESLG